MKTRVPHVATLGALLLLGASVHASAADKGATTPAPAQSQIAKPAGPKAADPDDSKMDVPAPPMLLLFCIGAVGLIWGRRLAAKANATKS